MANERLSRRLSALKIPQPAKAPGPARRPASAAAKRKAAAAGRTSEPLGVEVYLPGAELQTYEGAIYVHERRRSEMDKGTARFLRRLAKLQEKTLRLDCHEQIAFLLTEGLERAVFLDLETTGLSQSPVFLTGVMTAGKSDWTLRQYFARNYTEEKALVRHSLDLLDERPHLVTFNGRSFDWPFLKVRAAYHKLKLPKEPFHLDLLHHSRRHWKGVLENCRLQTLEWKVVGRRRAGDVDGAEIPGLYHQFVKDGNPWPLAGVFHHNLLDLVTMGDLLVEILEREVGEGE